MKKLLIVFGLLLVSATFLAVAIKPGLNPKYQISSATVPPGGTYPNFAKDANGNRVLNPLCSSYERNWYNPTKIVCACNWTPRSSYWQSDANAWCFDSTKPEFY